MLEEILTLNVYAFLLIFVRIGAFFLIAAGFSSGQVSPRIRLLIALAFSFVLTPTLADKLPAMPGHPASLVALILGEFLVGALIGSVVRILFSAMQVAGTITSFVSAMANALVFDPVSESQSAIVAGFLGTIAIVLLFVTNLHLVMLQAMIDSYSLFEPGQLPPVGDMSELIARHVSGAFSLGVQLAAPMIVVAFTYYLGLGLLTRLEPNIPIFFVGLPLQILIGMVTLMLTVSAISLYFVDRVAEGIQPFLAP
jgi:flagellar biosynthetic protein FliR